MRPDGINQDIGHDIAIVGGGFAGAAAAAMIARSGLTACLIDPHSIYPADFRCEALTQGQIDRLDRIGLLADVAPAITASRGLWIARRGRIVERRESSLYGINHSQLVTRLRECSAARIPLVIGNVAAVENEPVRQKLTLNDGRTISVRLAVLASGTGGRLRRTLGMTQAEISPTHSISLGFDLKPAGNPRFNFPALTYYAESPAQRAAYISLFPIGNTMRANLFVYREVRDPWLRQFREAPHEALASTMPGLQNITGGHEISGPIQIRPVDLYETSNVAQDGIVLIGDAFANSCPAAGTGVDKLLVDVARLCTEHLPAWFASEGMSAAKINSFYADANKIESDSQSRRHAFYTRAFATETGLLWRAMRAGYNITQHVLGDRRQKPQWLSRLRYKFTHRVSG